MDSEHRKPGAENFRVNGPLTVKKAAEQV